MLLIYTSNIHYYHSLLFKIKIEVRGEEGGGIVLGM